MMRIICWGICLKFPISANAESSISFTWHNGICLGSVMWNHPYPPRVSVSGSSSILLSSFIYRIFIYAAIILFIASKFFVAGVMIAGWAVVSMFICARSQGHKVPFFFSKARTQTSKGNLGEQFHLGQHSGDRLYSCLSL